MSTLVMNDIEKTRDRVSSISYTTNSELTMFRGQFHQFEPDFIFDRRDDFTRKLRRRVKSYIEVIDNLVEIMEGLTHKKRVSKKNLQNIYNIISLIKNLSAELGNTADDFSKYLSRREMAYYTEKISLLEEVIEDVEMVFFVYPFDEEFQKAANELAKVG